MAATKSIYLAAESSIPRLRVVTSSFSISNPHSVQRYRTCIDKDQRKPWQALWAPNHAGTCQMRDGHGKNLGYAAVEGCLCLSEPRVLESGTSESMATSIFLKGASFGVLGSKKRIDVTRRLRSMVVADAFGLHLSLPAGDKSDLFGDPAWLQAKHLIIRCQLDDHSQSTTCLVFHEHDSVDIHGIFPKDLSLHTASMTSQTSTCYPPIQLRSTTVRRNRGFATCHALGGGKSKPFCRNSSTFPLFSSFSQALSVSDDFDQVEVPESSVVLESQQDTPQSEVHLARPAVIHPMAVVHPDAILMEGVEVGPFCTVGSGAVIGPFSRLHSGSHVYGDTEIGARCILYTGAIVGCDIPGKTILGSDNRIGYHAVVGVQCQDLKYKEGSPCHLIMGSNNDIREHVSIHRSSKSDDCTVIGDHNLIMGCCHVAHDSKIGSHNILANGTLLGGHIIMEDYVHTGGAVAVHQFCHVGAYSFLAGGSMVARDVPTYTMVAGDRAELRGLNLEGMRRCGFSDVQVRGIRKIYQKLFLSSDVTSSLEERLSSLEGDEEFQSDPVVFRLVESVRSSFQENRRGICKFRHWVNADQ